MLASLDISAAVDMVPREGLLGTLVGHGLSGRLPPYIHTRLTKRRFTARLSSPQSQRLCRFYVIRGAAPQGGAFSPFTPFLNFDRPEAVL